jgi:hypothetical protein
MQGFRRQGLPVDIKPARKFRRQMLCIRGAAAVATEIKMLARPEPVDDQVDDLPNPAD